MKRVILLLAIALSPTSAIADSCVELARSTVINKCSACMEVTVRELKPRGERAEGLFTGTVQTMRMANGDKVTLPGGQSWALGHLARCQ